MPRRIVSLFFLLAVLLPCVDASGAEPFAQEKCALCHIRQSVFFDMKFAGPEKGKMFDEARMCASCHDGSVRDDRSLLWRGSQHPNPAPGDRSDGRNCSRCHSPHGKGGWSVLAGSQANLWKGGDAVCSGCHKGFASIGGSIHGNKFGDLGCKECHRAHGGVGKSLLKEQKEFLCLRCHASVAADKGGGHPLSLPSLKSKTGKDLPGCTECHPPHREKASQEFLLGRCEGCHDFGRKKNAADVRRHPEESGCLKCHSFHSANGKEGRMFRGKEISATLLCGKCHEAYIAPSAADGKKKGMHVTSRNGGKEEICFQCHKVHRGIPGTPLLASGKAYSCLACHEKQNTIRESGGIDLAHPVFERVAKGRLDNVRRSKNLSLGTAGEIVCATCHEVHKSVPETPLLVRTAEKNESCFWCHEEMRGKRHDRNTDPRSAMGCEGCHPIHGKSKTGDDPWRDICVGCHPRSGSHRTARIDGAKGKPADMPGFDSRGRKIAFGNISCPTCHEPHGSTGLAKSVRKDYTSSGFLCTACHKDMEDVALTPHDLRGIAGRSLCDPCHSPHEGKSPWMWGFDSKNVTTVEEACRSCHKEKGIGIPIPAEGHPVGRMASRPLPEKFPLMDASGGKHRSGTISCPTCHEVHGTGFMPSGKGAGKLLRGDCGSCHPGKEASHGKAVCEKCHPPHRKTESSETCRSCHAVEIAGVARLHVLSGKGCVACHAIHEPRKTSEKPEEKCVLCHGRTARILGTAHASTGEGACRACHPAHRNVESSPVKKRAWEEVLSADLPCLRCHREGGMATTAKWMEHPKSKKKVPTSYGATVTIENPVVMVGKLQESGKPLFPFFDEKNKPVLTGRMGCLTCHDPHAGTTAGGKEGGPTAGGYLRDPSGVFLSEICGACHRTDVEKHLKTFHEYPRKTD